MHENGNILLRKLDEFIRKYYRNQLIRGTVISLALLSATYLLLDLLEYTFRFDHTPRLVLFYAFLATAAVVVGYFVVLPLLKMQRIGKVMDHEEASRIIGRHFPVISDKLLNTLQLMKQNRETGENIPLLVAGIDQKIQMIRPFPFTSVIDLKKNARYLKYALPPLIVILAGIFLIPSVISVPAGRIIRYNKTFVKELPYSVRILNDKLEVLQQGDFELRIQFRGEEIPAEVFVNAGGVLNRMQQEKGFIFSHLFRSLQKDIEIVIVAGEMTSGSYLIRVLPRPIIISFETRLEFPAYIRRSAEIQENTGDLNVPEGTRVTWNLLTRDVDRVALRFPDESKLLVKTGTARMSYSKQLFLAGTYSMIPGNPYVRNADSMSFRINIIPDAFPSVYVQESVDSALARELFFRGTIKDDYGFSKLLFHYEVRKAGDTSAREKKAVEVAIDHGLSSQVFFHMWEPSQFMTEGGEELRYYFEVWDNDGIHGPKSSRSEVHVLKTPTLEEIAGQTGENEQNIQRDLENSIKESESARKKLDDLNRKMVEKNSLSFQERRQLEELVRSNEKILQTIDEVKKKNEENIRNSTDYLKTSEDILEKQKRLNELMEQLMTDEMKKLMKDIRELMDKVDKEKLTEMLQKMKTSQQDIETQLDRNLQLFKQLEFDRKLEETIRALRETAEKQAKLAEKTKQEQPSQTNQLAKEQKEMKEAFDSLKNGLSELKEKEKELENPPGLEKTSGLQDSIGNSLKQSESMLQQGNEKKASQSQKKSADQMNELADQLEQLGAEAESEQTGEDAAQIRNILESLLRMSFEQENLIRSTAMINRNDPGFQELIHRQKEIKDKLKSAEDSLVEISKRQFILAPVITREVKEINTNLQEAINAMNNRSISVAQAKQQYTMTSVNNLALLLDESLKQMNQNMQNKMQGKGQQMCSKPTNSGGSKKIKGMKDMQQQMSDQLKKLKEGLEKQGKEQGGPKTGQGSMNEQIARLAAQQEAIRNEMQKYKESLEEQGVKDGGNAGTMIQEMEMNERDLVNKRITQETLMRQEKIMSRLLESEKAELQREMQEKRESKEQKEENYRNFTDDFKYNILKAGGKEMIEYKNVPLNLFFRNRVNMYMIKIGQQ